MNPDPLFSSWRGGAEHENLLCVADALVLAAPATHLS